MEQYQKPCIAILMAVYDPSMDWLRQQLCSLNAQTYPHLRLYVRDDCSPHISHKDITSLVAECITAFPWTIRRNETNLGSNRTFQLLTEEAEETLLAYCDQDDVWHSDKLDVLYEAMVSRQAALVCSDMHVIDGDGRRIADCIAQVRRHQILRSGADLATGLLTHNFVTGCTTLVRAELAKAAVPFCPYMVHDQYLALYCAARGWVESVGTPTIDYRIHSSNQTETMAGVRDKVSYGAVRIDKSIEKFRWLLAHFDADPPLTAAMERRLDWMLARQRYWRQRRGAGALWRLRDCGKAITLFELVGAWLPESWFMALIHMSRKNII